MVHERILSRSFSPEPGIAHGQHRTCNSSTLSTCRWRHAAWRRSGGRERPEAWLGGRPVAANSRLAKATEDWDTARRITPRRLVGDTTVLGANNGMAGVDVLRRMAPMPPLGSRARPDSRAIPHCCRGLRSGPLLGRYRGPRAEWGSVYVSETMIGLLVLMRNQAWEG